MFSAIFASISESIKYRVTLPTLICHTFIYNFFFGISTEIIKSCPTDYKETSDKTKCYKEVESTVKVTGTKEVTYYRYRTRTYSGGTTDYKWSTSKNDENLLNAGYKLTGKTR